ncbi:MAG: T9SS type A sorting domain-containing protein, partial [Bacteroidales bacterium]|nr:T9SS type A sorting domain-containing protein [Bacteroidales bacterium]
TDITFKSYNPPSFGGNSFNGVRQTVNIFVPCGRTAVYLSATNSILPPNITEMPSFTFSATSSNIQHGNVLVLTQPNCTNPQAVIYATANSGYTFTRWSDGNTDNPRTLFVTQDTALVAYFSSNQGIAETETGELSLFPNPAQTTVTIENVGNEANIFIINAMGNMVKRMDKVCNSITFSVADLPKGIYFVRVGDAVRKLVVK